MHAFFFSAKEEEEEEEEEKTVGVKKKNRKSFKHSERRATGDGTRVDVAARLHCNRTAHSPDDIDDLRLKREGVRTCAYSWGGGGRIKM